MRPPFRKLPLAVGVASAAAVLAGTAGVAVAARAHLAPAHTRITVSAQAVTFQTTIDNVTIDVTCSNLTAGGTTPANGLTLRLSAPPVFSGCADNTGNSDTVKTSGIWTIAADSTGSRLTLTIPRRGASIASGFVRGCTVVVAPKAPAKISGAYNNANVWTSSSVSLPTAVSGKCTTRPAVTPSFTLAFSPNMSVVP